VFVSVQLTVRLEQSEYVIRCPDGAHVRVENGRHHVVVPSPFEVDEPHEMLWLSEGLLIEKARIGSWGFFLLSENRLDSQPAQWQRRPPAILNGHKHIGRTRNKPVPVPQA
jgi:hypothetical protein